MPKRLIFIACLLVSGALFWFYSSNSSVATGKIPTTPLVSLVTAEIKSLPLILTTNGHMVSLNQVDIRPQITSAVAQVAFHEGDFVKKGQLLFILDDAQQQATLHHAISQAAQTKALLAKSASDLERGKSLVKLKYISTADWDVLVTNQKQYYAQYQAAEDDIRTARVQLSYTRIYSPVDGKTGILNVHLGSLAQPSSVNPLVTINQFNPIGAEFSLPEQNLNAIIAAQTTDTVKVWVNDANGKRISGKLNFINNSVNTDSGTINFKASFDNVSNLLWPGLYQNITLDTGFTPNSVVLPPQAVQNGPEGYFVFVIDKKNRASTLPIKLLRIQQEMAVVEGVPAGMQVVFEGASMLRPGILVSVVDNAAAPVARHNK